MSENMKKEIMKYATPPVSVMILGVVFMVLSPILFFVFKAVTSDPVMPIVVSLVMGIMGAVFFCIRYIYMERVKNALKQAELNAGTTFLADDYVRGKRFLNQRIICGEHYVFGKGQGVILRLSDISAIIRETKHYRNMPTAENLTAKMIYGQKITICSISQIENNNPPYAEIIEEIMKNAPDIQLIDKRSRLF